MKNIWINTIKCVEKMQTQVISIKGNIRDKMLYRTISI